MGYDAFLHTHSLVWLIGLLLFLVTMILMRTNKAKAQKITHMILRLFYVLIIITGATLLTMGGFVSTFVIKGLLAILLIGVMEMIVARTKKGKMNGTQHAIFWALFFILVVVVILLGYGVI